MESQSEKTSVRAVCIERCKHGSEGGVAQSRPDYTLLPYINNWWLKHLNISPEAALEPRNNAQLGVWILAKEIQRHGYNWKAVGAYHSPTPARQRMYAQVVAHKYREIR